MKIKTKEDWARFVAQKHPDRVVETLWTLQGLLLGDEQNLHGEFGSSYDIDDFDIDEELAKDVDESVASIKKMLVDHHAYLAQLEKED
jgi:hypothetical protein